MVSKEEHGRILREWQEQDEKQRLDRGLMHEHYCTLCGIPFWLYMSEHFGGPADNDEGGFAWASYFLARKWLEIQLSKRAVLLKMMQSGYRKGQYQGPTLMCALLVSVNMTSRYRASHQQAMISGIS